MVRYAKLPLDFDAKALQTELTKARHEWQAHFNTAHYDGEWSVLALRSPSGDAKNIIPELMGNNRYQDTTYMQSFPAVEALLQQLHCPVMAVRFLNLEAGATIKQHRDSELAFEKGEARLHFPVVTNPDVEFYIEDDRIILGEGECWYINANLLHRVSNHGATDRIHLVVDCEVNEWLKGIILSSPEISHGKDNSPVDLTLVIKEFRMQNTTASNRLADELERELKAGE